MQGSERAPTSASEGVRAVTQDQNTGEEHLSMLQPPTESWNGSKNPTTKNKVPEPGEGSKRPKQTPKPREILIEAMLAELAISTKHRVEGEVFCFQSMDANAILDIQDVLQVYKATANPDTMYLHRAMREKDWDKFREAMGKEVKDQMDNLPGSPQIPKWNMMRPSGGLVSIYGVLGTKEQSLGPTLLEALSSM